MGTRVACRSRRARARASAAAPRATLAAEPPDDYLCPITQELMSDPVIATDGHTYERKAILQWIERKATSPKTGEPLTTPQVFPNHLIRGMILEWKEQSGEH